MDIKKVYRLSNFQLGIIEAIERFQLDIVKYQVAMHKVPFKYATVNELIDDALIDLLEELKDDLISVKAEYVDYFGIVPSGIDLPFDFDSVECEAPTAENTSESE